MLLTQWALKVGWEALLTPVTYAVVGLLKRREGVDVYDEGDRLHAVPGPGLELAPHLSGPSARATAAQCDFEVTSRVPRVKKAQRPAARASAAHHRRGDDSRRSAPRPASSTVPSRAVTIRPPLRETALLRPEAVPT